MYLYVQFCSEILSRSGCLLGIVVYISRRHGYRCRRPSPPSQVRLASAARAGVSVHDRRLPPSEQQDTEQREKEKKDKIGRKTTKTRRYTQSQNGGPCVCARRVRRLCGRCKRSPRPLVHRIGLTHQTTQAYCATPLGADITYSLIFICATCLPVVPLSLVFRADQTEWSLF